MDRQAGGDCGNPVKIWSPLQPHSGHFLRASVGFSE